MIACCNCLFKVSIQSYSITATQRKLFTRVAKQFLEFYVQSKKCNIYCSVEEEE